MLLLLFHLGNNLCAIETNSIIEIVPLVVLRKIQPAHHSIAGVLNYHGKIIPVIDLCQLICDKPSQACYSTRIVIVQTASELISLIIEQVLETLKVSEAVETTEFIPDSPALGRLLLIDQGMVQLINWECLAVNALAAVPNQERMVNSAGLN